METKAEEITRLRSEIAVRECRLADLVLGDPRVSINGGGWLKTSQGSPNVEVVPALLLQLERAEKEDGV